MKHKKNTTTPRVRRHRAPIRPEPNRPEWLASLATRNPRQALMTGIVTAGRPRSCSICGDTAGNLYALEESPHTTVRLCDECRDLQLLMYGLIVVPADDALALPSAHGNGGG